MTPVSAIVTTYNNADTLEGCLASLSWADEILVLDSFSTDETQAIAERAGAVFRQHAFLGYGPQKQSAAEMATHDWILLLDADEMLTEGAITEITRLRAKGLVGGGYELARIEQLFWKMSASGTRKNHYLRLYDKRLTRITDMPIHGSPHTDAPVARLSGAFLQFGETSIHAKVEKINGYSTGLVADKVAKKQRPNPLIMVVYPPFFFLRSFFFKRGFFNGWAGFIASVTGSFYVFLKYAKLYEHHQREKYGESLIAKPDELPLHDAPDAPPDPSSGQTTDSEQRSF
jgi:glycosyltransferase involved in cell wall biosynthesis